MQTTHKLLLVAAVFATSACGGKIDPAKEQVQAELTLPEFEGKGKAPFALTDDSSELLYKANLLFWNDSVTPEQIQRVSNASIEGRKVRADFLAFLRDEQAPHKRELAAQRQEKVEVEQQIVRARKENFDEIVELQRPLLEHWTRQRLADLREGGKISLAEEAEANLQFGLYCEAKLWETAVDVLLKKQYPTRPTPLIMCEEHYEAKGILSRSTELCKDAPAGQTKDYLACFWKEGVVKTSLFEKRRDLPCSSRNPKKKMEAIEGWLASGELLAAIRSDFDLDPVTHTSRVINGVLDSSSVPKADYPFVADCPTGFKLDSNPAVAEQAPLQELRNIVEADLKPNTPSENFRLLLPRRASDNDQKTAERYALVAKDLRTFAVRSLGASVNDRIFNNDATKSVRESEEIRYQYETAPGFAAVRQVEADYVPAALKQRKATNEKRLAELEKSTVVIEKQSFDHNTALTTVIREGALAARPDEVSVLFVGFALQLNKLADRIEVRLQINPSAKDSRGALGCVSLADGSRCEASYTEAEKSWTTLSQVEFNAEKNALTLTLHLDDPTAQGLVFEASETKHNEIPESELIGRDLRLTAYSNRLKDSLDFFTGKAELVDLGEVVREGSVSGDAYGSNAKIWE